MMLLIFQQIGTLLFLVLLVASSQYRQPMVRTWMTCILKFG